MSSNSNTKERQTVASSDGRASEETAARSTKDTVLSPISGITTIENVDEGLEKAGNCGAFQKYLVVALILGYMTGELIVQNMAYLELMPAYQCQDL